MSNKWLAIVSGVALLLAIPPGWPYGYYTLLRWLVFVTSAVIAWGFYKSKLHGWSLVFVSICFLFNPIIPVYLNKNSWVPIDFVSAMLFFLAAYAKNKKPNV